MSDSGVNEPKRILSFAKDRHPSFLVNSEGPEAVQGTDQSCRSQTVRMVSFAVIRDLGDVPQVEGVAEWKCGNFSLNPLGCRSDWTDVAPDP